MERRIITTEITEEDKVIEPNLRPQMLKDYIGQEKIKTNLKVYIDAAKVRGEALDHVLFYGPPGLGKTTLSGIIANEMGVHMKVTSGPAIEKPGEMAAILNNLQEGDVLFVDEIHRLNRQVEEVLYLAMGIFWLFFKPSVGKLAGGNYELWDIAIRHNTLKGFGRMLQQLDRLIMNRIWILSISVVLVLLSVWIYDVKRKGGLRFHVREFIRYRKREC